MRAMFASRTKIKSEDAIKAASMLDNGSELYLKNIELLDSLRSLKSDSYISLYNLYSELKIDSFSTQSKRKLYEFYSSGIIVGAGSGEDCKDLVSNNNFKLIDLTDKRMLNFAAGYENKKGLFNSLDSKDGDTLNSVNPSHKSKLVKIPVKTIDSMLVNKCEIISVDAEGAGLDVLAGSIKTIEKHKPDLFISIYHNWIEYLLIIPMLYDMGYSISCVRATNPIPYQPHLDLNLFCIYNK